MAADLLTRLPAKQALTCWPLPTPIICPA